MADGIRATPRQNQILGLLADRLKQAQQFGAKPFGYENPPVEMLMNLLGVPAVQQTLERMSYGEPLTTGKGMTTQVRPEAMEAAMTLLPMASGIAKATKNMPVGMMFIGPESQSWNKTMAFEASKMAKKGATPQEIWKATGTVKGPDGQWRQEISDETSKFNLAKDIQAKKQQIESEIAGNKEMLDVVKQRGKEAKDLFPKELTQAKKDLKGKTESMEQSVVEHYGYGSDPRMSGNYANVALEHPALFEAYPELRSRIVYQGRKSGDDGTYGSLYGNQLDVTSKGLLNDPRSTTLHEMQHAIQDVEGFGVGGTARDFAKMRYDANQQIGFLNDKMREVVSQMDNPNIAKQDKDALSSQYEDLMNQRMSLVQQAQIDPMEAYRSLMGEAESRLTQRRMNLNPEQRLQNFPFEYTGEEGYGLDVPLEGLIQMAPDGTIIKRGLLGL